MADRVDFWQGLNEAHAWEVARGEHDRACEYGVTDGRTTWRMCGCSQRRRERDGHTGDLPGLEFCGPPCPRCGAETDCDDGVFSCPPCRASWNSDGSWRGYTDEHHDYLPTALDGVFVARPEAVARG